MNKNFTCEKLRSFAKKITITTVIVLSVCFSFAQTTIATNLPATNGSGLVTFNFRNNNTSAVAVTNIASISSSATVVASTATLYYKTTPINGAPGLINAANGWLVAGTSTYTTTGSITAVQPMLTLNFTVPAGVTYGFAFESKVTAGGVGNLRYNDQTAGTNPIFSGGGGDILTGSNISYGGAVAPAAPTFTPRGFTGTLTFISLVPCTGTPAPGNTTATATAVCAGTSVTLSPQNSTSGSGVTYQWQSGPSVTGPFTDIPGATSSNYTFAPTAGAFYRVVVTCAGASTPSNPVQVSLNAPNQCYCASTATAVADEDILNVTLGTLNQSSTCATTGTGPGSTLNLYSNYTSGTGAPAAPSFAAGSVVPMSVSIGTCGTGSFNNSTAVFIDFNQDGDLDDAGERVYFSPAATAGAHVETFNITIPGNAVTGTTRMRVVTVETSASAGILPCGTYTWGETEDYNVTITPCIPVAFTSQPANAAATCGAPATFTVGVTGTVVSYQWQYRVNATSPWLNVVNAPPFSGATTATLTVNPTTDALNGYQFRVLVTGGCTAANLSSAATLTVSQIVTTINTAAPTICLGSIQALTLTNSVAADQTMTFTATGLPAAIPDGPFPPTAASIVNLPITVAGIPAGSIIKNIGVRFSITHPYVGDLVMNLTGPNGTKMNVFALLDNGAGTNATANFTNTVIDSLSTAAISGAPAPRTGSFRADRYAITNPNYGPLATTNTSWAGLLSTINGTWTVNLADLGDPDAGTITALQFFITYNSPTFAQGTFTGPAGTIFSNPAGTVPYTGTPATTVYVNPATAGVNNYSVSFVNGGCTSTTLTIPVTVNTPAGGTLTIANRAVCAGTNATFTVTGQTGSGLTYQWQVATAAAPTTFTNIAGATGATYTVTAPTFAMNGNLYRVVISSTGCTGSITSPAATLTVYPTPVVVISAAPATNVQPGQTVTLTAAVSPNAAVTYQWFLNGSPVPGATMNTLVVGIDGRGTYTVAVTDVNGCTNSASRTSTPASITIGDSTNRDALFIYPTPNNGQFQVRLFTDRDGLNTIVNVYDSKGARVYTRTYSNVNSYNQMNVDLGSHGKGIYRVEVTNTRGERLKTGSVYVF